MSIERCPHGTDTEPTCYSCHFTLPSRPVADQLNLKALREMLARKSHADGVALYAALPALIAHAEMAGKLLAALEDAMRENYSHPDGPFLNDPQRAATVIAAARAAGIEPEP